MIAESFLAALTNADQDGRIVVTKKTGTVFCILYSFCVCVCVYMGGCVYVCVLCMCA